MKLLDVVTLTGEHTADLMVAAFGDRELRVEVIDDLQFGRQTRFGFAGKQEITSREDFDEVCGQRLVQSGFIDFLDDELRRCKTLHEFTTIRDKQQTAGVLV